MKIEVSVKVSFEGWSTPLLFTSDKDFLDLVYRSNHTDNRNYLKLQEGDSIILLDKNNTPKPYQVYKIEVEYITEFDKDMFKYGIVSGQVGELGPYNLCVHIIIKE